MTTSTMKFRHDYCPVCQREISDRELEHIRLSNRRWDHEVDCLGWVKPRAPGDDLTISDIHERERDADRARIAQLQEEASELAVARDHWWDNSRAADRRIAELEAALEAIRSRAGQNIALHSIADAALSPAPAQPATAATSGATLVHFSRVPFIAVCGADVPNQSTAAHLDPVTCQACVAIVAPCVIHSWPMNATGACMRCGELPGRPVVNSSTRSEENGDLCDLVRRAAAELAGHQITEESARIIKELDATYTHLRAARSKEGK